MDNENSWENLRKTFGLDKEKSSSSKSSRIQLPKPSTSAHQQCNATAQQGNASAQQSNLTPQRSNAAYQKKSTLRLNSATQQKKNPTLRCNATSHRLSQSRLKLKGSQFLKAPLSVTVISKATEDEWKWMGEDNEDYLNELVSVTSQYDAVSLEENNSNTGNLIRKSILTGKSYIITSGADLPVITTADSDKEATDNSNTIKPIKLTPQPMSPIITTRKRIRPKLSSSLPRESKSPGKKHCRLESSNDPPRHLNTTQLPTDKNLNIEYPPRDQNIDISKSSTIQYKKLSNASTSVVVEKKVEEQKLKECPMKSVPPMKSLPSTTSSLAQKKVEEQKLKECPMKSVPPMKSLPSTTSSLAQKQQRSDLKMIKDCDLTRLAYNTKVEVIGIIGAIESIPRLSDYNSTKEIFQNLNVANNSSESDDADLIMYKDIVHSLFIKKPLSSIDAFKYVTNLVRLCEKLLNQAISDIFAPRIESRKDYCTITLHNWWMDRSLHDPEPWCLMEICPLLRRSLALLVEASASHKEILLKVLELTIVERKSAKRSQDSCLDVDTCSSTGTSSSVHSSTPVVSSSSDDDLALFQVSSGECTVDSDLEQFVHLFDSTTENRDTPEFRYEKCEPSVTDVTLYLVELLSKLISLAVTYPEAHLLEGNICAALDVLAGIASTKSFISFSQTLIMWTLCRTSLLKMTPNLLIRLTKTACAITMHLPATANSYCLRSRFYNLREPCFVKRFCLMLHEIFTEEKAEVCETDILLGKTAHSYFLKTEFYPPQLEPAPKKYKKQLILSILKWMYTLHSVPAYCAAWYAPLYQRKSCCDCFKDLFNIVMKQVFKWFSSNNYKIEGDGELEFKALHVLYKVKSKVGEEFPNVAENLHLDSYHFARMLLRENKTKMCATDIKFAERVCQTEPMSAYRNVVKSFRDVIGPCFQPPAVPLWAGPYPYIPNFVPDSDDSVVLLSD